MTDVVTGTGTAPPPGRRLQRYEAVVGAVLALAADGGYDAVQMRHVADRSGVALATIYRYFGSRETLVYLATDTWLVRTTTAVVTPADAGTDPLAYLVGLVRASAAGLGGHPLLLEAWVRAAHTRDAGVARLSRQARFADALRALLVGCELGEGLLHDLSMLMEHVWLAGITRWAYGQKDYAAVSADVEQAVRLAFRAHGRDACAPVERTTH